MRSLAAWLLAVAFAGGLGPLPAVFAHGGSFVGPTIPPPPSSPLPSPPPGGARGGGQPLPGRTPRSMTATIDVRRWETWWGFNREDFFPSRGVHRFRGMASSYAETARRPPAAEEIREKIIPVLLAGLGNRDADIRDSAAVALGKVGDVREFKALEAALGDKQRTVVEGATLGLGLLRCDRAEKLLVEIASDDERPALQRGYAVLALGLSGGEIAREALSKGLGFAEGTTLGRRARAAGLESLRALAAGLATRADLPGAEAGAGAPMTLPLLKALEANQVKEQEFPAVACVGLAKTRDPIAQKGVLATLAHRKMTVRAGAAIAVGRVFKDPDKKVARALAQAYQAENDDFVRRMLLISFGRMGGDLARKVLESALEEKDRQHRAFALLGLAIHGARDLAPRIRAGLVAEDDQSLKAAHAIALGILKDQESLEVIQKELERHKNPELQLHLIQALILLGDPAAAPAIQDILARTRTVDLQATAALALGLIGPTESGRLLLQILKESGTIAVKGAVASGLGRMGDHSLVDPLVAFVTNEDEQDLSRAFGYVALGILGEKDASIPPFSRVMIDSQYELRVDAIDEVRDIL